jgi:hypothetical protein
MCEKYKEQEQEQKQEREKSFRISAKRLLLTYSQVGFHTGFTVNNLLEQLQFKLGNFSFVISQESHSDRGMHFHVLLIRSKKFDIRAQSSLDLKINGRVAHGNYQPINNIEGAVQYVCKEKQYITNLENLQDGKLLSAKEFIYQQVRLKGVDKALLDYSQTHKEKALAGLSVSALKKHFNDIKKIELSTKIDKIETPFTLNDFNIDSILKEWIQNPIKTLIVVGQSGIGKTQFLKAIAKEKFYKTLIVSHKEDLRRLDDTYDSILIDDANIDQFEDTQLLSLIDNQVGKTLRVLYDTVFKKEGIVQMIAMNRREFLKIYSRLKEERMLRRVLFHHVKKPFIINLSLQIQNNQFNNYINNNYNKQNCVIDIKKLQQKEKKHVQQTKKLIDDYYYNGQDS